MLEIWRTAIYKGEIYDNYQVSNLGRLMSLNYKRTGKAELMTPKKRKDGYLMINFRKNGKSDGLLIHRLVAETFLPNPEGKPQVNHKIEGDEGKKINIVFINKDGSINKEKSTIEWVTAKENCNYGTKNLRAANKISKANTNGKRSKKLLQFTLDGDFVREWESTHECGRNGFNQGCVSACCRGERKSHKGYIWRYK